MNDPSTAYQELIAENAALTQRILDLEHSDADRKRTEDALRASEALFRAMTEHTGDVIALTDAGGVITYVSSRCEHLFRCAPEEMCGRHFSEFLDESVIPDVVRMFRAAIDRGERTDALELTMKRKGGARFVGELTGSRFRSGAQDGTLVVIRDITDRKEREAEATRARTLLEACIDSPADIIILATDRDYRYLTFNSAHKSAMKQAYGVDVEMGMNILDCITSVPDRLDVKASYDRALAGESHAVLGNTAM